MQILLADTIFSDGVLLRDHGVVFDQTLLEVASNSDLRSRYGEQCLELGKGSVLLPGLINPHVHLEFSANRSTLTYGEFMPWLSSVIASRDELINECDDACTTRAIEMMLANGITAFGAVSSYGFDLEPCFKAPQKVVYFNELIGSDPAMADALYANFQERLFASQERQRDGFYPSVAIHSPYSVHRILIQKALKHAYKHGLRVTAHFMESLAEREWLDSNIGPFQSFFQNFLKQSKAANTAEEFLSYFRDVPTLFTHAVQANDNELAAIKEGNHSIIHCPVSNRLLGNGSLNLDRLNAYSIPWLCGTDGLSSNYTLDLFEEMKASLFIHHSDDLASLATAMWKSVTSDAATALRLNCGTIAPTYDADLLVVRIDYPINDQLPIHLITQPRTIESVYVQGVKKV
ncbi:MAG: metal-dependent hydrolase [Sulfuricurvum sp.]|nr:metal-dependent hydrolase [Sulfuricurvum sp.]